MLYILAKNAFFVKRILVFFVYLFYTTAMDEKKYLRNYYDSKDSGKAFIFAMLALFAVTIVATIVALSVANIIGVDYNEVTTSLPFVICNAFCGPIAFVSTYLIYSKCSKISFKAINLNFRMGYKNTLLCIAVAFIALFGLQFYIGGVDEILRLIGYNVNDGLLGLPLDNVGWLFLNMFLYAFLPAIAEEIIFRGVILQGLRKNMSDSISILISAALFALMHCNLQQLVFPMLIGLILGWIATRTGSLLSSIIVHFVNNSITIFLAFIAIITQKDVFRLDYSLWWVWVIAIVLVLVTFAIFYLIDKFYFKHKNQKELTKTDVNKMPPLIIWIALGVGLIMFILFTILH